jgi:hypothetical protein
MVLQGAALGETQYGIVFLIGFLILDEPNNRLLAMEQWATGTGGAHVFRWDQVEQKSNQIVFSTAGRVAFVSRLLTNGWSLIKTSSKRPSLIGRLS